MSKTMFQHMHHTFKYISLMSIDMNNYNMKPHKH